MSTIASLQPLTHDSPRRRVLTASASDVYLKSRAAAYSPEAFVIAAAA